MPIFVPPETPEPDLTEELRLQRKQTDAFIRYDPQHLALIPTTETRTASGAISIVDGSPRETQVFRLIPMSHTERPTQSISNGTQRKHDFTLLGSWDAMMAEGDYWEDERGERWIIDAMVPHNRYETRGLVTAYGRTR